MTRVPSYRLHRPSGRAVVTICGRDHYLGRHGSPESRAEYERLVGLWLARGRPRFEPRPGPGMTVSELILAYWEHVKRTYDRRTAQGGVAPVLRRLRRLFGPTEAGAFGPRCLKTFQQSLVQERSVNARQRRLSRRYVNRCVNWVRRLFRWAVSEEMISASVLHGLMSVEALRAGRTEAPETRAVEPVDERTVAATLPMLSRVVADMVRIQRLTGMRPGELCAMRPAEIDTRAEVWRYTPRHHKTAYQGRTRSIPIGPRAQAILRSHLKPELDRYIFSPVDAVRETVEARRAARRSRMTPSQRRRDASNRRGKFGALGERYTTQAYALAIWRACDRAGIPRWSPNRLRHARATELRATFGLDAACAVLGHAKVETTQIYAQKNLELADRAALATG